MSHNRIVSENQLDVWVRGNARDAQGVIVELVWRLISASTPRPKERRFPLGDSIGQPGPDGFLETDFAFDPFVPEGRSLWEIGTSVKAGPKATQDYRDRTRETPAEIRRESTFIFVTPLSGGRDWQFTWKPDAQARWLANRRKRKQWRDVRTIDWLQHYVNWQMSMSVMPNGKRRETRTKTSAFDRMREMRELICGPPSRADRHNFFSAQSSSSRVKRSA